jgi:hypothetical protein
MKHTQYVKVIRAIHSCRTYEQLEVVRLWVDRLRNFLNFEQYTEALLEISWGLQGEFLKKEKEIK